MPAASLDRVKRLQGKTLNCTVDPAMEISQKFFSHTAVYMALLEAQISCEQDAKNPKSLSLFVLKIWHSKSTAL